MSKKTKKNHLRTVINLITFAVVVLGLFWVVRSYLGVGTDNHTNSAQVDNFINPINTRVSAYIKEIRFIEHQEVKKGDTLLILDDREIKTQLGQAQAAHQATLASKNTTQTAVQTVANNVATAEANIQAARARLANSQQNYNRYRNLVKQEAVTRQQFDQVETEYLAQKAQYEALVNSRNTASLSVNEVKSRVAINEAEIKRAENALEMAKLNFSYTVIVAPHDGIMGRRVVNTGQLLNPSQQVATIVDNTIQWITANFRENQMEKVKLGGITKIKVDALGGKEFEGKVTAISGATGARYSAIPVDNSTGNFVKVQQRIPVRIEFTKNNKKEDLGRLRAGMNVEVTLK